MLAASRRRASAPVIDPRLHVWIEAQDVDPGAGTSLVERAHGRTFAGSWTRDTSIGGLPTIVLAPGSSNYLASAEAISQFAGETACTMIACISHDASGGTQVLAELGPDAGSTPGTFISYRGVLGGPTYYMAAGLFGDTSLSSYGAVMAGASIAPEVWSMRLDLSLASGEAEAMWRNGTRQSPTAWANPNNGGALSSQRLYIGARAGTSLFGGWGITSLRIYAGALSDAELLAAAAAVGATGGVSW